MLAGETREWSSLSGLQRDPPALSGWRLRPAMLLRRSDRFGKRGMPQRSSESLSRRTVPLIDRVGRPLCGFVGMTIVAGVRCQRHGEIGPGNSQAVVVPHRPPCRCRQAYGTTHVTS